ncbi:MAG: ribosome maturation factor RimM [Actinomycetota bacterium]|nr:ribosome maturation factor RimM [Actinomycetota bacterium]
MIPISDDPRRFEAGSRLEQADGRTLVVRSARNHGNRFLVAFEGYEDRDAAETLRGALYVDAADARELDADEFWEHELTGLTVVRADGGDIIGTVSHVQEGPAQDLLVVDTPAGERLVPLVAGIVVEVDVAAGRVTLDPPQGLL